MSALPLAVVLVSVDVDAVAPVVLVESLVAPIVLLDELGVVLLLTLELGSLERDVVSDELVEAVVSGEVELPGDVLLVLLLGYVLVLGEVLLAVDDVPDDDGVVLLVLP